MASARIAWRIALVSLVFGAAVLLFTFRGEAAGDTFATGSGVDLRIDSRAWYNGALVPGSTWHLKNLNPASDKFFNFGDIKPGDSGKTVISMHVKKKSAWLCLDFKNLKSEENGINEPEGNEAPNDFADGMEFFAWHDDGDNVFEVGERPIFGTSTQAASSVLNGTTYAIGDSKEGGACGVNQTRYVGIFWCAGNLSANLATAELSCDGSSLGNEAQTDSMSVDISIRAEASHGKPKFVCGNSGGGGYHSPSPYTYPTPYHSPYPTPQSPKPKFPWFRFFPDFGGIFGHSTTTIVEEEPEEEEEEESGGRRDRREKGARPSR